MEYGIHGGECNMHLKKQVLNKFQIPQSTRRAQVVQCTDHPFLVGGSRFESTGNTHQFVHSAAPVFNQHFLLPPSQHFQLCRNLVLSTVSMRVKFTHNLYGIATSR
jgi:hypothetical protein